MTAVYHQARCGFGRVVFATGPDVCYVVTLKLGDVIDKQNYVALSTGTSH
jgi:hypothetical protein